MKKILGIALRALHRILPFSKHHDPVKPHQPIEYEVLPDGFSPEEYLLLNPDVQKAGMDAAAHYKEHGAKEGRSFRVDMSVRCHTHKHELLAN